MTENHTTQHFSNLCIISTPNSPPPPHHHRNNHPPCSLCGCPTTIFSSPLKRKNMEFLEDQETPSTDQFHLLEPKLKKPMFLDHQETSSPPPFPRSISDPLPPRSTPEPLFPRSISDPLPIRSVPENPNETPPAAKGGFDYSALPPRYPSSALLRRTNSDDPIVSLPDKNCSLCGCPTKISSPLKCPSPKTSTDFYFNEPKSKRLVFLDPQETPSSSLFPRCVSDPLPQRESSPAGKGGFNYSSALPPRPPPFRRTNSDPIVSSPSTPESTPEAANRGFDYSALPPRASPSFRRTNSDPIVLSPTPANTMSLSASFNHESPNHKDQTEESETMSLEEKNGDIFVDLRCPCGETYAIIFSGRRVYYKVYHVHH